VATATLYRHFDAEGRLLYVGISARALQRLATHGAVSHWFHLIVRVTLEHFPSRADALLAEAAAIKAEGPLHNIAGVTPPRAKKQGTHRPREKRANQDLLRKQLVGADLAAVSRLGTISLKTLKSVVLGERSHNTCTLMAVERGLNLLSRRKRS